MQRLSIPSSRCEPGGRQVPAGRYAIRNYCLVDEKGENL